MSGKAGVAVSEELGRQPLFRGYAGRMLQLLVGGAIVHVAGRFLIPALLPAVIEDFSIGASEAGLALSVMLVGMAVFQYIGGRYSDGLSRKTVLMAAFLLFVTGFVVLLGSPTFIVFIFGALLVGSAHGMYFPASLALLSDLFDDRRGEAFGINNASFSLGSALAPGLAVITLAFAPWRVAFIPIIGFLFIVLLLMHRWSRDEYVFALVNLDAQGTVDRLLTTPQIRRSLFVFGMIGFVWQGGVNFIPTFLQLERGISQPLASAAFAGLFITGMITTPIAGNLGDRLGYLLIAASSLSIAISGILLLVGVSGILAAVLGALFFGGGVSAFWPVMNAYVMESLPEDSIGGDFGAINSIGLSLGSLGPAVVGVVAERSSFSFAFGGLVGCLLVSILILGWVTTINEIV